MLKRKTCIHNVTNVVSMNLVIGISKCVALDFLYFRALCKSMLKFSCIIEIIITTANQTMLWYLLIHTEQNFRLYFLCHKTCSDKVLWSPRIFVSAGRYFLFQVETFRVLVLRHFRLIMHDFFYHLNSENNGYFTSVWQFQKQLHGEYFAMNSIARKHCDEFTFIMHSGDDFIDGRLIFITITE